jgi:flagellar hook-basal body complex protein FliE
MAIEAIAAGASAISSAISSGKEVAQQNQSDFSNLLNQALANVEGTETASQDSTAALLTGGDEGIHTAMIEADRSYLALSLAVQVRNKVLNAYNEIMQMQL